LALPKRAAGTAPLVMALVMADCSSPWLTEWLTDKSYSFCEGWQERGNEAAVGGEIRVGLAVP